MGSRTFSISASNSTNFTIFAQDQDSLVSSQLNIELILNNYEPSLLNSYRVTNSSSKSILYIDSNQGIFMTGLEQLVSGWNLSSEIGNYDQSIFILQNIKVPAYQNEYFQNKLKNVYNYACFDNYLYTINS